MGTKITKWVLSLALFGVISAAPLVAEEVNTNGIETLRKTSKAFSAVAKQATPAVVAVKVRTKIQSRMSDLPFNSPFDDQFFERFFGPRYRQRNPEPQWQEGQASGFIISSDGYILTNYHVIKDVDEITVIMSNGQQFEDVKVIGSDKDADVALLKIKDAENLPSVELGDSDDLEIGEWVIAIGNPFGLTETLTVGVVSALGRKIAPAEAYQDFIQTDAAINPGNSGGPLLNLEGKVVGINAAIITGDRGYMGIGLAVPINTAKGIKEQLITTGKVQRGYLGVLPQNIEPGMVDFFKLENNKGAILTNVEKDSPAEKAGLKKDDVIIRIGDKQVEDGQDVRNIVGYITPGTDVEFTIVRNGKEKKIMVKIGSREDSKLAETSDLGKDFGLTVETVDEDVAKDNNLSEPTGVVITDVEPGSPAAYKGLRKGMIILEVNREVVNDVSEFNEALKKYEGNGKVLLGVKTGRYIQYILLQLDD